MCAGVELSDGTHVPGFDVRVLPHVAKVACDEQFSRFERLTVVHVTNRTSRSGKVQSSGVLEPPGVIR